MVTEQERPEVRTRIVVRGDTVVTVLVALVLGICLGVWIATAVLAVTVRNSGHDASSPGGAVSPASIAEAMATPCATEDSDDCVWLADRMGNGEGDSFVTVEGHVFALTAAVRKSGR